MTVRQQSIMHQIQFACAENVFSPASAAAGRPLNNHKVVFTKTLLFCK